MPADGAPAVRSASEVERKYDVGATLMVPDLQGMSHVDSVSASQEHLLEAVYFDTADLRLLAAGITLRHRSGGSDAGWHLKLPAGDDREELTVDGGAGPVPQALAVLVRAWVRGGALAPVAELSTRRQVQRLLGPADKPLVELADDRVTGRALPEGKELVWREWEVELLDGDRALLDVVQQRLTAAGAAQSTSGSKLARVLGGRPVVQGDRPWWAGRKGSRSAGAAVQAHLAEQVAELVRRDPQVRRDVPDAVHKMRVATRRLRSALATFRPLLDRAHTDPLRVELRWLAAGLGAARDAEVMHARLRALVDAEPPELVLGPVRASIDEEMTKRYRTGYARLIEVLDGERYLRLLDALDALVLDPPFLDVAHREAHAVLARLVRRSWRRLDRAMVTATRAPLGPAQHELLHQVRKDAKRARYAAEAVEPVFGPPADRFAAAMERMQESLGDFHDGVVTGVVLLELGAGRHVAGENGFSFGRLHAQEQRRAEEAVARWPQARTEVSRRRLRRWFQD